MRYVREVLPPDAVFVCLELSVVIKSAISSGICPRRRLAVAVRVVLGALTRSSERQTSGVIRLQLVMTMLEEFSLQQLPMELVIHTCTFLDLRALVRLHLTARYLHRGLQIELEKKTRSLHPELERRFKIHVRHKRLIEKKSAYGMYLYIKKRDLCVNCAQRKAVIPFKIAFDIQACCTCCRADPKIHVRGRIFHVLKADGIPADKIFEVVQSLPSAQYHLRGTLGTYYRWDRSSLDPSMNVYFKK